MQVRRPKRLEKWKDFHFDKATGVVWQGYVAFMEKITVERTAGFIMQSKQLLSKYQLPYHRRIILSPTCTLFSRSSANFNVLNLFFNGMF